VAENGACHGVPALDGCMSQRADRTAQFRQPLQPANQRIAGGQLAFQIRQDVVAVIGAARPASRQPAHRAESSRLSSNVRLTRRRLYKCKGAAGLVPLQAFRA